MDSVFLFMYFYYCGCLFFFYNLKDSEAMARVADTA